jgi:hypothetical protein
MDVEINSRRLDGELPATVNSRDHNHHARDGALPSTGSRALAR